MKLPPSTDPARGANREGIDEICAALSALRIPVLFSEMELHRMILEALRTAGIEAKHEQTIAPRCRIDFLVGSIGIEVKRGKYGAKALHAQAARYLASPALSALILVTNTGAHLPQTIGGKPVCVFGLSRLWGVSLP